MRLNKPLASRGFGFTLRSSLMATVLLLLREDSELLGIMSASRRLYGFNSDSMRSEMRGMCPDVSGSYNKSSISTSQLSPFYKVG